MKHKPCQDFNPIPKPNSPSHLEASRQEIAEAFRQAKELLLHGLPPVGATARNYYICYCLEDTGHPAYAVAQAVILERIAPDVSYEAWLIYNNPQRRRYTTKELQPLRHQWLDSLIKEFSA